MDAVDLALKERVCDATDRIPTSKWPFFSTTLTGQIAIGGTELTLTFEAERDTLLTDLSISVTDVDAPTVQLPAALDIEYCNIQYAENTNVSEFGYCCQRKPIFLVGVRENKKLRFVITLPAALADETDVEVTISGFQAIGCCD